MTDADRHLAERAMAAQRAGRAAEAEALWRHLLAVDATNAAASYQLGLLLASQDRLDDAAARFRHVLALLPNSAEAAGNLGFVYQRTGRMDEALQLYRRALAAQPDLPVIRNNLAAVLHDLGRVEEAVEAYRLAAQGNDSRRAANYLTALNLVPGTLQSSRAAAEDWAARFAEPLTPPRQPLADDPQRRLRIGYVAADGMRRHTLAMTWLPLIEAHDRGQVEVVVYSDLAEAREDDVSRRCQAYASWQRTGGLTDAALAERIRADRVDILVEGFGFAAGTRLLAFARRPAPVQLHFPPMATTGLSAIDYIVSDASIIPSEHDDRFTESVWRLPCGFLYAPLSEVPPTAAARRDTGVTFGSFNRLAKIGPDVVRTWARILNSVPASRLLLKTGGPLTTDMIERYRSLFAAHGISAERLEFRGRTSDSDHFRNFGDVDIMLDPFPHGGVLTTCDALFMGVPVVTLVGERILERYSGALLSAAGATEGIAHDVDDYVARAITFAGRCDELTARRGERGRQMRASPLCDAAGFARAMEESYRAMWRARCAGGG